MSSKQYIPSITIRELRDALDDYLSDNPHQRNKMIYFDCLAINGKINEMGDILELY